jgi:hypothetical protein
MLDFMKVNDVCIRHFRHDKTQQIRASDPSALTLPLRHVILFGTLVYPGTAVACGSKREGQITVTGKNLHMRIVRACLCRTSMLESIPTPRNARC